MHFEFAQFYLIFYQRSTITKIDMVCDSSFCAKVYFILLLLMVESTSTACVQCTHGIVLVLSYCICFICVLCSCYQRANSFISSLLITIIITHLDSVNSQV